MSTDSEPVLVNLTLSTEGTILHTNSAQRTAVGKGAPNAVPLAACSLTAATTLALAWPRIMVV